MLTEFVMAYEAFVRLAIFATVFATMASWEVFAPRRPQRIGRDTRWPSNVGVSIANAVLVRAIFPISAVALAAITQTRSWGLLNVWQVAPWVTVPLSVVVLDLVIYLQHVLFHAVPALWRLHRMHHADLEFDVTTGGRFHPIEMLLSTILKFAVIVALGAPPFAVFTFEVLLNATAMFNHSNVRMPLALDRVVRWVIVTPDMHRVHHSVIPRETNANFGFNLSLWDRLFGTYRAQPKDGHHAMTIGIAEIRDPGEQRLDRMLSQPFRLRPDTYALGTSDPSNKSG
jgi:sterol desaturase/sphingolipid hydroxylase (fatty acid hydroxylase superfamily)